MDNLDQIPPNSAEAELALLSSFLDFSAQKSNANIARVQACEEELEDEAWYHPRHLQLWQIIRQLAKELLPIDYVHILTRVKEMGKDDALRPLVADLQPLSVLPNTHRHYIKLLKECHLKRKILAFGQAAARAALTGTDDAQTILGQLQQDALTLAKATVTRGPKPIRETALTVMDEVEVAIEGARAGKMFAGMRTGFPRIDEDLNGLVPTDRLGIAAQSSTGKTAILCNIAYQMAEDGHPGIIFSLDGQDTTIVRRMLSNHSSVSMKELTTGRGLETGYGSDKLSSLVNICQKMGTTPIWIDDRPGQTIQQIIAILHRMKEQHQIKWAAVDFFQKIRCPGVSSSRGDFVRELAEISTLWMGACIDLQIAGIMLSQLNRESFAKGRPNQSNVKGCSNLFEDSTKFIFLSKEDRPLDEVVSKEKIPPEDKNPPPLHEGERIICAEIGKNKDGPIGPYWLRLRGNFARFDTLALYKQDNA